MKKQFMYTMLHGIAALTVALMPLQQAMAQTHFELNGGFETGPSLCPTGNNGPFYLAQTPHWATNWTGINLAQPANFPVNTGNIHDNTASCTFGNFSSPYTPYAGHRAISLESNFTGSSTTSDERAIGNLTGALQNNRFGGTAKLYQICIALANGYTFNSPTVQVVLISSTGAIAEKSIGSFALPSSSSAWANYSNAFSISATESGKYDQIEVRMDLSNPSLGTVAAYIDNVQVISTPTPPVSYLCSAQVPNARLHHSSSAIDGADAVMQLGQNPVTNGTLILQFNEHLELGETRYEITDMIGRRLLQGAPQDYRCSVDVTSLSPGMYIVHSITGEEDDAVQKFIVK